MGNDDSRRPGFARWVSSKDKDLTVTKDESYFQGTFRGFNANPRERRCLSLVYSFRSVKDYLR